MKIHEELRAREFELLRAEIVSHQHIENNWALFAATGTGATLAFAIERQEALLCVVVPFVVLAASYRIDAVRHSVWRISSFLALRFDEPEGAGSSWETSLTRWRAWRARGERGSPWARAWVVLFTLLLSAGVGGSALVWVRSFLPLADGSPGGPVLGGEFWSCLLTTAASLLVLGLVVYPKFGRWQEPDPHTKHLEDWRAALSPDTPSEG